MTLTEEEYLSIERTALDKSEFHDGHMVVMPSASAKRSLLAARATALLHWGLNGECRVFNSQLRIKIEFSRTYTYADGLITCGELQLASDQRDNLLNPLLIVEVLSPSTQDYIRGKKFELYRTIESFREYLVIHQDRRFVEHHSKQDDGSWLLREHTGKEGSTGSASG